MEKQNFGDLLKKLCDDLPDYSGRSIDEEDNDQDKSVTPPPDFADIEKKGESPSNSATLKSPSKLKSMLSFRKEKA